MRLHLRDYMPRSLYGRAALILMVPVVAIQLVVSVVFIQRTYDDVTRQMTAALAREVAWLSAMEDDGARRTAARQLGLRTLAPDAAPEADRAGRFDLSGRVVIEILRAEVPGIAAVALGGGEVRMRVATPAGETGLSAPRRRVAVRNPHQLLVIMVATSVLMTVIAFFFLRNQLRPVKRMAAAAEAFGKGRTVPLRMTGATEMRAAAAAFLEMRGRIERHIEQRTLMLSGVSHDLRTPLTRMKLALSMAEEGEETEALAHDVAEMERMLDSFLDFARGTAGEDSTEEDPAALAEAAVDRARRAGRDARMGPVEGRGRATVQAAAVARALDNLVGNACRYGTKARVSVTTGERSVRFRVEDDGPGIPEDRREEAMRPFARLDLARNQDAGGGVGLGRAIAADVARRHGGVLRLGTGETWGGLAADLVLAR